MQTGHLRTSSGSFFIEPSPLANGDRTDDETTAGVVRHVIYRVRHPFRFEQPLESPARPAIIDDPNPAASGTPTANSSGTCYIQLKCVYVLVIQSVEETKGLHHRC